MSNISLLREKFTIRDVDLDTSPTIALGNRVHIKLPKDPNPLIIRGHSMHMTLRFGAELIQQMSYVSHIEDVASFFKWKDIWAKLIKPFEKDNTPNSWIVAYYMGKPIFDYNPHHIFFDVIEQCEYKNRNQEDKYQNSIIMAQDAFKQSGRTVLIEQESHVGFILDDNNDEMRFAVILRVPNQKATFITRMSRDETVEKTPYNYVCMNLAANFIEAINMAVRTGFMEVDVRSGKIARGSDAMKTYNNLQKRLTQLDLSINQVENQYVVLYRPEKPDFQIIQESCMDDGSAG